MALLGGCADRHQTIMPCSKVLVMDKGSLVQQGSPFDLIRQDGGKFQDLCMASGPDEYRHLLALAEQSSLKNVAIPVKADSDGTETQE